MRKLPELEYDPHTKSFKQKIEPYLESRPLYGDPGLGDYELEESDSDRRARELAQDMGPRWVDEPKRKAPKGTYIPAALAKARKRIG